MKRLVIINKFLIMILFLGVSFSIISVNAYWEERNIFPMYHETSASVSSNWAYGIRHFYKNDILPNQTINESYNTIYDAVIEYESDKFYKIINPFTRSGNYQNFVAPLGAIKDTYTRRENIAVNVLDSHFHPENIYRKNQDIIEYKGYYYYFKNKYNVVDAINETDFYNYITLNDTTFESFKNKYLHRLSIDLWGSPYSWHRRYYSGKLINYFRYKVYKPGSLVYYVNNYNFKNITKFYIATYDYTSGLSQHKLCADTSDGIKLNEEFWTEVKEYDSSKSYVAGDYVYWMQPASRTVKYIYKILKDCLGSEITSNNNSEIFNPIV